MRLRDTDISGRGRDGLGGHRGPVVGMDRELLPVDALLTDRVRKQLHGHHCGLLHREELPHRVAGENIDDAIQMGVQPLRWILELRDFPRPNAIRFCSHQLGLLSRWMGTLRAG